MSAFRFHPPVDGEQLAGCTDTGAPEKHTEEELSRLYDAMYAGERAGINPQDIFRLVPDSLKMEFNYSKWVYRAERR